MLEERGFSTVALASVRVQAEKTRPPRALWTSAVLGRPVAEPDDRDFQLRVLRTALGLLERTDGPVILEDFPDDPPGLKDTPGWTAPATRAATVSTAAEWRDAFRAEMQALMPLWKAAQDRFGRTSIGLSFLPPEAWPDLAAEVLAGGLPVTPRLGTTALTVRFFCDDLKALYGEAAQAKGPKPSPMQVDTWFWRATVAGEMLRAIRKVAMESENNGLKTVGGRFFVPTPWV
ncbi:MAG TPA: hypothetical protein VHB27_06300 [Rhodopila sp.]|uniref:hypothetical protein n=1 Tax=Rhodopila sp. TaxID=2480087 RepID=UPI002CF9523A|nr:hypothetical protein [Rhodopila sp.]HVY14818.1 hypothetical protein [Rhodopila sp.]